MKALLVIPLSLKLFVPFKRKLLNYYACVTFSIIFFILRSSFSRVELKFNTYFNKDVFIYEKISNTFVHHFLRYYISYQKVTVVLYQILNSSKYHFIFDSNVFIQIREFFSEAKNQQTMKNLVVENNLS